MMSTSCCPIVELRQYTLYAGRRDTLIELFDREFVIPQERLGLRLLGQFRDLDDPDRFVWLRGFASWEERPQALGAFYTGEAWKAHREAANATMSILTMCCCCVRREPALGLPAPSGTSAWPA